MWIKTRRVHKTDKRKHIVHIISSLSLGGSQQTALEIASNPLTKEYRHSFICGNRVDQKEFLEVAKRNNFAVYECYVNFPSIEVIPSYRMNKKLQRMLLFSYKWRLSLLLRWLKPDLVHSHLYKRVQDQGYASLKIARVPWVWTQQGMLTHFKHRKDVIDVESALGLIDCFENAYFTAVSQSILEETLSLKRIESNKYKVIHNGADLIRYNPEIPRDPVWRTKLGITDRAVVIGSAARLVSGKRIDLLIEAAKQLIDQGENAVFVVAGRGPLENELLHSIRMHGLTQRFHLLGYQRDMQKFLREIDVFVLPTDSEGLPLVLAEACAMGIPCIATNVGGVSEIINDEVGILVPKGSVDGLVDAMKIMMDERVRSKYASNTVHVAQRFNMDDIVLQYKSLYDRLLTT